MDDFLTAIQVAAHWVNTIAFYAVIGVGIGTIALMIGWLLVANARDRRNPFALSPDVQADREAHLKRAWGEQR